LPDQILLNLGGGGANIPHYKRSAPFKAAGFLLAVLR
jgi:hypothetical protein